MYPQPHPGDFKLVALFLVVEGLIGAGLFLRRAPAFSLAVFGGLVAGFVPFFIGHQLKGVPLEVAASSFCGLVIGGVVGLARTRGRPPSGSLKRWGVAFLALAAPASGALGLVFAHICPLYENSHAGYCWWDQDLLGGWLTAVILIFFLDMVVLAGLLFASAWQADEQWAEDRGPEEISSRT